MKKLKLLDWLHERDKQDNNNYALIKTLNGPQMVRLRP